MASASALHGLRALAAVLRPEDLDKDALAKLLQAHMALTQLMAAAANTPAPKGEDETLQPLLAGDVLAQAEAAWRCLLHGLSETQVQILADTFI